MPESILYIPLATFCFSLVFSALVFHRYRQKGQGAHLLWWSVGILIFGIGTFCEGFVTVFGWNETIFRAWYISGALLGGAPLAQGTVYLLMSRKTANILTVIVVVYFLIASCFLLLTPLNHTLVESNRLSGDVIVWQWTRLFSPFINTYAVIFLVGGAALSAYRFKKNPKSHHRYVGNVFIAVGAMLPAVGGSFTRFGYTEILYITELLGLTSIYIGYRYNIRYRVAPRDEASGKAETVVVENA